MYLKSVIWTFADATYEKMHETRIKELIFMGFFCLSQFANTHCTVLPVFLM